MFNSAVQPPPTFTFQAKHRGRSTGNVIIIASFSEAIASTSGHTRGFFIYKRMLGRHRVPVVRNGHIRDSPTQQSFVSNKLHYASQQDQANTRPENGSDRAYHSEQGQTEGQTSSETS